MDTFVTSLIAAAWVGVAVLLGWNVLRSLKRARSQDANLPFFGMLRRYGLSEAKAEEAVGIAEVSRAVRRCVFCRSNEACREKLADECPNAGLLERAQR
jgi:hypothetical protein